MQSVFYDMHGNAQEWVDGCQGDSYTGAPNAGDVPRSFCDRMNRILRGGSWFYAPEGVRSAFRAGYSTPGYKDDYGDGFGVPRRSAETLNSLAEWARRHWS